MKQIKMNSHPRISDRNWLNAISKMENKTWMISVKFSFTLKTGTSQIYLYICPNQGQIMNSKEPRQTSKTCLLMKTSILLTAASIYILRFEGTVSPKDK